MKKSVICGLFLALGLTALNAGDVATFVDKGFTDDGKYYVLANTEKQIKNSRDMPKSIR